MNTTKVSSADTNYEDSPLYRSKYHYSSTVIIFIILSLLIAAAIAIPVILSQIIYPNFIKLQIESTEREAIQTGKHMARAVLDAYANGKIVVTPDLELLFDQNRDDYDLLKIKIFSNTGETIYSSDAEDIGILNTKEYFHTLVAKGNIYTMMVRKNTKSLEDQIISSDVVETYLPIMDNGVFVGAFELYYNITAHKTSLDNLIKRSNNIMYTLTVLFIIVVLAAMTGLRRGMKVRQQYEEVLIKLANTDRLTGIYNRRKFEELLALEIGKFNRYKRNSAIFLLDIDHFKAVNDSYGHLAGDEVLASLAGTCRKDLRDTDIFARYGGEEFIIILPEMEHKEALEVADRIRSSVEKSLFEFGEMSIKITVSIGIALFSEINDLTIDTAIKYADKSMYKAKEYGRNQVYCCE